MVRKSFLWCVAACLLVSSFALSYNVSAEEAPWAPGDGWGYRWQMTFGEMLNEFRDALPPGCEMNVTAVHGGISCMLYVKYVGEDDWGYRFDYVGGIYARGYMAAILKREMWNMSTTVNAAVRINTFDIDFSGSFWLVRVSDNITEYYGIARHAGNISGEYEIEVSTQSRYVAGNMTVEDTDEMMERVSMQDISLTLVFDRPVPLIPVSDVGNVYIYTDVSYWGHVRGEIYSLYTSDGTNVTVGQTEIDRDVEGAFYMYASLQTSGGDLVSHPDPIFGFINAAWPGYALFGAGAHYDPVEDEYRFDWDSYQKSVVSRCPGWAFYTDYRFSPRVPYLTVWAQVGGAGTEDEISLVSQPATEEEVSEYLQNKAAYTPGLSEESAVNAGLYIVYAAVAACAITAAALVVYIRTKRRKGAPPGGNA